MSNPIEDRKWFESAEIEVNEMLTIVRSEKIDKETAKIVKQIANLMEEIDQQIQIGNPIVADRKKLNTLLEGL